MSKSNLPQLTESIIRAGATPQSFARGQELNRAGAISNAAIQSNLLSGHCEGTMEPFYRVTVQLDDAGIADAACSCAYDYEGYCKHIVALLLAFVHKPKLFAARQAPDELLAGLSREDLSTLLQKLLERQPELYDWLEAQVRLPNPASKPRSARKKKIDAEVYRRQVRNVLHSLDGLRASEAYWGTGGLADGLREVQASAQKFLDAGDPDTALAILMALVEEFTKSHAYEYLDDSNGEFGDYMDEVGVPLAEAILSANLTAVEREEIAQKLNKWMSELDDYGVEGALDVALDAARYGWEQAPAHHPPSPIRSARIAQRLEDSDWEDGEEEEWDEDESELGEYKAGRGSAYPAADLTDAKLNVLERQDRTDEYLALCQKTERHLRYARKLCELGRVPEGVSYALKHLNTANETLTLAMRLRELKHTAEALAVGEHGLKLKDNKFALAEWLAPIEEAQGRNPQALAAWLAAFEEQPSLETYQRLKRLGAASWGTLQPRLFKTLKKNWDTRPLAEVFLFEEQWDEAIKIAERPDEWGDITTMVADAVISQRPTWVVQISAKQAEQLIGHTQSKYYAQAAEWLKRMKKAYAQLDKTAEWRAYLNGLKETYKRRPALQAQLQRL